MTSMAAHTALRNRHRYWLWPLFLYGVAAIASSADAWWSPGDDRPLPAYVEYGNASGRLGIVNTGGQVIPDGHPFFEPLGANGRAGVSCHQPADGMSVSVPTIAQRWQQTKGSDPLFAMVDG